MYLIQSFWRKAGLFALKTAARPALESFGTKVGEAFGKRLGRRIDPEGADDDDPLTITEDERTP